MKKDTKNGQTRVSWVARGDHYKDGGPITRTHTCDSQRGGGALPAGTKFTIS